LFAPQAIRNRPRRATAVTLLEAEGLPASDLTDAHLEHFFFAGTDDAPTGLAGVELYGVDALLRSLIVGEGERGKGLGSALVRHVERYAASRQVRAIYLLTITAEAFFKGLGYERIERSQAPTAIQQTREFASLCPASSAFMVKLL
jgi:amino-acid N-acetyltransferase